MNAINELHPQNLMQATTLFIRRKNVEPVNRNATCATLFLDNLLDTSKLTSVDSID